MALWSQYCAACAKRALIEEFAILRSGSSIIAQPKAINSVAFRKHSPVSTTVHSRSVLSLLSRFHLLVSPKR